MKSDAMTEKNSNADMAATHARPLRVLCVDDNRDAATTLAMLIQLAGNETETAHDGLEAVKMAAAFRPDIALLDLGLPKMNGYEAAREIRQQRWGQDIVLVALTGQAREEDKRQSRAAGFNYHIVKPLDPAALEDLIAESRTR